MADADNREDKADDNKRNTVDHFPKAYRLLTCLQSKESVDARQREKAQCVQPAFPSNESGGRNGKNTNRSTNQGLNHGFATSEGAERSGLAADRTADRRQPVVRRHAPSPDLRRELYLRIDLMGRYSLARST